MINIGSIKFIDTNKLAEDLSVHVSKGIVNFALPIQRGYVWDRERKSNFILNMLEGGPTFPIYVNKVNGIDYVIDGQQRARTVNSFIENNFALSKVSKIETRDNEIIDISGKRFDELNKDFQNAILRYNFGYNFGENLNDNQVRTVFLRLNSGKPLSSIEMTKAQIISVTDIMDLAGHNLFNIIMDGKGIEKSLNASLVMQTYVAIFEKNKSMFNHSVKNVLTSKSISIEEKEHIKKCFDVFEEFYKDIYKENTDISIKLSKILKNKKHFIPVIYTISEIIKTKKIDMELFSKWLKHFFNSEIGVISISDDYNNHIKENTSSNDFVKIRLESMYNDYLEFACGKGDNINV